MNGKFVGRHCVLIIAITHYYASIIRAGLSLITPESEAREHRGKSDGRRSRRRRHPAQRIDGARNCGKLIRRETFSFFFFSICFSKSTRNECARELICPRGARPGVRTRAPAARLSAGCCCHSNRALAFPRVLHYGSRLTYSSCRRRSAVAHKGCRDKCGEKVAAGPLAARSAIYIHGEARRVDAPRGNPSLTGRQRGRGVGVTGRWRLFTR